MSSGFYPTLQIRRLAIDGNGFVVSGFMGMLKPL